MRLCERMRAWPSQLEHWGTASPDELDVEMMLALADVEKDICSGCGGYLSKTTIHDHGYHIDTKQCGRCEALAKWSKSKAKEDQILEGTPQAEIPEARKLFIHPIPIPDDLAQG